MDLDLPLLYDTGPAGFASVVTLGETSLAGILDTVDATAYDVAAHTTHTLRHQASTPLAAGDLPVIDGVTYKVLETPRRINTDERIASLARQD